MSPSKLVSKMSAALASAGATAIIVAGMLAFTSWPFSVAAASELPADELGAIGTVQKVTLAAAENASSTAAPKVVTPVVKRTVKRHAVKRRAAVHKVRKIRKAHTHHVHWRVARASWYGPGFYGHTMAGGGRLQRNSMVVAHRSLPFGTRVQITYRGRTVIAVVRDRGPYVGSRQFDLGPGTARSLGFGGVGTIHYRILGRG